MALDILSKSDIATIIRNISDQTGCEGVSVEVLAQESRLDSDLLGNANTSQNCPETNLSLM